MKIGDRRSILGIDPTKRGLAFVFFEYGELIDWGTRSAKSDPEAWLLVLGEILTTLAAEVVVLEDPDVQGCVRRPRIRTCLRAAASHAKGSDLVVLRVSRIRVRQAWKALGNRSKQSVAERLADDFPELGPLVPPPRKVFMDEDARLQIFDALTLVLAASDRAFLVSR